MRRGRGSFTSGERDDEAPDSQLVPERTEATNDRECRGCKHRVPALRFPRIHVRDVHFDKGDSDRNECIPDGEARVRVRAGIDHDAMNEPAEGLDRIDQISLPIVLGKSQRDAQLLHSGAQPSLDVVQGLMPV